MIDTHAETLNFAMADVAAGVRLDVGSSQSGRKHFRSRLRVPVSGGTGLTIRPNTVDPVVDFECSDHGFGFLRQGIEWYSANAVFLLTRFLLRRHLDKGQGMAPLVTAIAEISDLWLQGELTSRHQTVLAAMAAWKACYRAGNEYVLSLSDSQQLASITGIEAPEDIDNRDDAPGTEAPFLPYIQRVYAHATDPSQTILPGMQQFALNLSRFFLVHAGRAYNDIGSNEQLQEVEPTFRVLATLSPPKAESVLTGILNYFLWFACSDNNGGFRTSVWGTTGQVIFERLPPLLMLSGRLDLYRLLDDMVKATTPAEEVSSTVTASLLSRAGLPARGSEYLGAPTVTRRAAASYVLEILHEEIKALSQLLANEPGDRPQ